MNEKSSILLPCRQLEGSWRGRGGGWGTQIDRYLIAGNSCTTAGKETRTFVKRGEVCELDFDAGRGQRSAGHVGRPPRIGDAKG